MLFLLTFFFLLFGFTSVFDFGFSLTLPSTTVQPKCFNNDGLFSAQAEALLIILPFFSLYLHK